MTDAERFVGRTEEMRDRADGERIARLADTLDHEGGHWTPGVLPLLGHWLCFRPAARQSQMGADGHPLRTDDGLLPNVDLPRRMWAGGRLRFLGDIPLDAPILRRSELVAADPKDGRSGRMLFAKVRHEIGVEGEAPAIVEEQDIVYLEARDPGASFQRKGGPVDAPDRLTRAVAADPVMLFRYSALTFNSHRIHYDAAYAREEEGYPALVVHGPLIATLLLDHLVRLRPGRRVLTFGFRAVSPLFVDEEILLGGTFEDETESGVRLRAVGPAGVAMQAEATLG